MPLNDHARVRWDGRKWPDRLHWQFTMRRLGEDEHGTWLVVPAGTVVRRGHEAPRVLDDGFVSLVPPERWWEAEFYAAHSRHEVYVNIGTPCEWHPGRIRQVDLDLDVIRTFDGTVEVIDEEEFDENRERFAYPAELVVGARRAAAEVARQLSQGIEPFGAAAQRWMGLAGLERVQREAGPR